MFDISVLIPTYKRKEKLLFCLESIIKAKKHYDVEIIIVDNDSKSTIESDISHLLNDTSIKYYLNNDNLGMTGNWNKCLELACGDYVLFVHDDDFIYENYFDIIIRLLKNRDIDFLASKYDKMVNNDLLRFRGSCKLIKIKKYYFLKGNIIGPPTGVLLKRSIYIMNNLMFDDSYYPCSDFQFWMRFINSSKKNYILKKSLYCYRIDDNESLNVKIQNQFLIQGSKILEEEYFSKNYILKFLFKNLYYSDWAQSMKLVWKSKQEYKISLYNIIILKVINRIVH